MSGFFFTAPKKLKDEKTQNSWKNSSKKLKDSAKFGVDYSKNQRKWPKNKGELLKYQNQEQNNIELAQF